MNLSLCHTDPGKTTTLQCELRGLNPTGVTGRILATKELNARNTFDNSEAVKPRALNEGEVRLDGNRLTITLPPASVAVLSIPSDNETKR